MVMVLSHVCVCFPWILAGQALCPWDSPGKNTELGFLFLLQGIFSTQGLNLLVFNPLHWQADSSPLHHLGSHIILKEEDIINGKGIE